MAWVIAGIVDLIGINMAMSLTVEGAFDAPMLAVHCRKALRKMAAILLPCAALVAFARALVAEALRSRLRRAWRARPRAPRRWPRCPRRLTELYLGALRAQSRTSLVALIQAARAVLMLGLALILTGRYRDCRRGGGGCRQPGGHRRGDQLRPVAGHHRGPETAGTGRPGGRRPVTTHTGDLRPAAASP